MINKLVGTFAISSTPGVRHAEDFVKWVAHKSPSLPSLPRLTEYVAVLGALRVLEPSGVSLNTNSEHSRCLCSLLFLL